MAVQVEKAIRFKCEHCGKVQFGEYTLIPGKYMDREVNEDHILCEQCNHDNHVIEEL